MSHPRYISVEGHTLKISNIVRMSPERYVALGRTRKTRYVVIMRGSRPVFLYEQDSHDKVKLALEAASK